jgi:hypothetical protein
LEAASDPELIFFEAFPALLALELAPVLLFPDASTVCFPAGIFVSLLSELLSARDGALATLTVPFKVPTGVLEELEDSEVLFAIKGFFATAFFPASVDLSGPTWGDSVSSSVVWFSVPLCTDCGIPESVSEADSLFTWLFPLAFDPLPFEPLGFEPLDFVSFPCDLGFAVPLVWLDERFELVRRGSSSSAEVCTGSAWKWPANMVRFDGEKRYWVAIFT